MRRSKLKQRTPTVKEFMNKKLGNLKLPRNEYPTTKAGGAFTKEFDLPLMSGRCFAKLEKIKKCILTWKNKKGYLIMVDDILGILVFGSTVKLPDSKTYIHKIKKDIIEYGSKVIKKNPSDIDLMVITKENFNGEKDIVRTKWIQQTCGYEEVIGGNLPVSVDTRSSKQIVKGIKNGDDTIATNCMKDGVVIANTPDLESLIKATGISNASLFNCFVYTQMYKGEEYLNIDIR